LIPFARFRNWADNVKLPAMAAKTPEKTLQQVVDAVGTYPVDAYLFVREGLSYTADKIHGQGDGPEAARHISGRDLCMGLREYALQKWGYLARTVLRRWNVTTTLDFGRIVFALVEYNHMQKTEDDTLLDFRQVYDFHAAFERDYRISGVADCDRTPNAESKK
jgi:uncharacterized repeat protein (TIGR04138 family)